MSQARDSEHPSLSPSDRSQSTTPDPEVSLIAEVEKQLQTHAQRDLRKRKPFLINCEHDKILNRAVLNILATDLALETYAQIIDGLPLGTVVSDARPPPIFHEHPVHDHIHICAGAVDRARCFRDEFDILTLTFHPALLNEFRHSVPGSQIFNNGLIELVSYAIHDIGVYLSKLDLQLHEGGAEHIAKIRQWKPSKEDEKKLGYHLPPLEPPPTLFIHPAFEAVNLYPEAQHDMVGYWAENRILGGVPAFHRAEERFNPEHPPNVYMNCARRRCTNRIYQLHDSQQQSLIDFLTFEPTTTDSKVEVSELGSARNQAESVACPLPLLPDRTNRIRVDVFNAISDHLIFRDIWERMPPTRQDRLYYGRKPMSELDYPENRDIIEAVNRLPLPTMGGISSVAEVEASSRNETNTSHALNTLVQDQPPLHATSDMARFCHDYWEAIYSCPDGGNWAERMTQIEVEQDLAVQERASEDQPIGRNKPGGIEDEAFNEPPRKRVKRGSISSHAADEKNEGHENRTPS